MHSRFYGKPESLPFVRQGAIGDMDMGTGTGTGTAMGSDRIGLSELVAHSGRVIY